ncbi:MAG: Asp-tRNA(Asn)/Glu-tRNA(Gln) amidotransferase subunit GatC [bacterium]|nr:Asp-tRNA(Asn)/Glu-tRNA(Gln) amidotransferase subunit GatC [bacterium]
MKLTKNEIIQLSELARIKLTNQEIKKYGDQISSILDYVKQLDEVDTSKVKTQSHIKGLSNVFKSDVIDQKDEAKKIINQFPEKAGNLNKVKAVMDK